MATTTVNLKLTLPGNSEFTNIWDQPVNNNFTIIDTAFGNINGEVVDARGSQPSLTSRLDVQLNADGTLKPIPEITKAETSQVYGRLDSQSNNLDLDGRILLGDYDAFYAANGDANMQTFLARLGDDWKPNSVVSSATNYLTFTGAVVRCDGSLTKLYANINGYLSRVRILANATISGPSGPFWMKLTRNPSGVVILDNSSANLSATLGTVLQFPPTTGPAILFQDNAQNFVTLGVQPGDLLKVTTTGANFGTYVVQDTNTTNAGITVNQLLIKGTFPALGANLNYQIVDPYAATLGFETTDPGPLYQEFSNKIYVGTGSFDGTNVLSLTQYQNKGIFTQWQAVTLVSGNFENIYTHQIGFMPTKYFIYASASNDYTNPLVPLGIASGASGLERNVIMQIDRQQIKIKNAIGGLFYKDYNGVSNTSGFLLVVAER